ncbi:alkaline phosphatase family protein [Atopococcus tabaci]|uniref:alkaline phosphatase family protein n=1 Tax=Atopococcus tabaci TaxID=269774 RepID=UPI002408FE75|nr:alkaline phosphatase family protein [Atopococcus tabaci]
MTKRRLYIISLDAFGASDLEYARTLPHFRYLLSRSALVKEVETVYPSLTYMCHTSIATGMYPHRHGVVHNTKLQPDRSSPDWYWYAKDIKTPTFFDVAHKAGYKTASFLWPVTGRSQSIDYNLTEIFPNRSWQNQVMVSLYSSTPSFALHLDRKYRHLRKGIEQPQLDDFLTAGIVDTIRTKNPDLMAIHFVDLDAMRHKYGVQSLEAKRAIKRMDERLGKIIRAMKEKDIFEETVIAVLGDHYQIDTHTAIRFNALFKEEGWLRTNTKGKILSWDVLAKEAGGSCYIYTSDQADKQAVLELLRLYPDIIEAVYTGEQADQLGADTACTFLVEARRGFYFQDENEEPFEETVKPTNKLNKATHGYSPLKDNYETMLFISGPGINTEARIPQARLVDEGPTFLHALGLAYPHETEGRVLKELFE